VALDALTNVLYGDPPAPDIHHYFGDTSIITKKELAGTLSLTPALGRESAMVDGATIAVNLTLGRERLRRLGTGPGVSLRFQNSEASQDVEVFGIEIPWHELGRR
jgi:hypothetical protein